MKNKLPYTTNNILAIYLEKELVSRKMKEPFKKITLRQIEEELANYCSLSRDGIVTIKRGLSQPSLAVAFKVAEFFNADINEIFMLKNTSDNLTKTI